MSESQKASLEQLKFDVVYSLKLYFYPLVVIKEFLSIFGEFFRQMVLSAFMKSEDFEKLQELKFEEENQALSEKQEELEDK